MAHATQHTKTPPAHTPTPWRIATKLPLGGLGITDTDTDGMLAVAAAYGDTPEEEQANAAYIVRACNSFEALVDALSDLVRAHDVKMGPGAVKLRIELARDALKAAQE